MALTPNPAPQYPDVPRSPGVPSIFRDPTEIVFTIRLLEADVATVLRLFEGPQWGIFTTGGVPIVIPNSVVSVDFRREWRLADYPVENGGFEHYDKVATPYDARIRFACDGTTMPRELFLSQLDFAAQSLDPLVILTKDGQYPNANIHHIDYRRERSNGVGIVLVDIWLQEIRSTIQSKFTNTKSASGVSAVDGGSVQSTAPTPTQAAAVSLNATPAAGGLT